MLRTLILLLLVPLSVSAQFVAPKDIDGDGIIDTVEDKNGNGKVDPGETDPLRADMDGGGEADGSEIHGGRDPLIKEDDLTYDRDGDGLTNGKELGLGTDQRKVDTDGDGFIDSVDPFPLEKEYAHDENKNGLPDEWEQKHNLPQVSDPKAASKSDPSKTDADNDTVSDLEEYKHGTDPTKVDTDRDGKADAEEIAEGSDPSFSACIVPGPEVPPFPDAVNIWASRHIAMLQRTLILPKNTPLVSGYPMDGATKFLPERSISRFEFLKIVLLGNCIALRDVTDAPFKDMNANISDARLRKNVIGTAKYFGIVEGYPDGTFRPDASVTRAEAVKILLVTGRFTTEDKTRDPKTFPDVSGKEWFSPHIDLASAIGLIDGYADGFFRPQNAITRAEAAKIVHLALRKNPRINRDQLPPE